MHNDFKMQMIKSGGKIKKERNPQKTKKIIKGLLVSLVAFLVLLVINLLKFYDVSKQEPENITNVLESGEYKEDMRVKVGVYAAYDYYAQLVKYSREFFIDNKTTLKYYYPVIMEDGSIISLSVTRLEDLEKINDIYLDTLKYAYDTTGTRQLHETVFFEGELENVESDSELQRYYDDFYASILETYDVFEAKPNIYNLNISVSDNKSEYYFIFVALGILIATDLIALLVVIKQKRHISKKEYD